MGTKSNPGKFDCYANALPDEPMFVLLGRDRHAAEVVRYWIALRLGVTKDLYMSAFPQNRRSMLNEKLREALECSEAMDAYRAANQGPPKV